MAVSVDMQCLNEMWIRPIGSRRRFSFNSKCNDSGLILNVVCLMYVVPEKWTVKCVHCRRGFRISARCGLHCAVSVTSHHIMLRMLIKSLIFRVIATIYSPLHHNMQENVGQWQVRLPTEDRHRCWHFSSTSDLLQPSSATFKTQLHFLCYHLVCLMYISLEKGSVECVHCHSGMLRPARGGLQCVALIIP